MKKTLENWFRAPGMPIKRTIEAIGFSVPRGWIKEKDMETREAIGQVLELMYQYSHVLQLGLRTDEKLVFCIDTCGCCMDLSITEEFTKLLLNERLSLIEKNYQTPGQVKDPARKRNKSRLKETGLALLKLLFTRLPLHSDRVMTAEEEKRELKQLSQMVKQSKQWLTERNITLFNRRCKWSEHDEYTSYIQRPKTLRDWGKTFLPSQEKDKSALNLVQDLEAPRIILPNWG